MHLYVEAAQRIHEDTGEKLTGLANLRLAEWRMEFARKFPRLHGRIIFGNGAECVLVGDRQVYPDDYYRTFKGLRAALLDVSTITDGYRLACPDDVAF